MFQISDNLPDVIKVLSAIKKDSEREKAIAAIKDEHKRFLKSEVDSRRIKSNELIKEMVTIDIALREFETNYEYLKSNSDVIEIEVLEDYIRDIKKYRRKLAREKNRK
ncbi:hypothetical protein ABFP60_11405 [Clostridioides difficile]